MACSLIFSLHRRIQCSFSHYSFLSKALMYKAFAATLAGLCICLILASCKSAANERKVIKVEDIEPVYITHTNPMSRRYLTLDSAANDMAEGLVMNAHSSSLSPVLITTFVSVDNFNKTSSLGRVLSELVMTELQAKGIEVVEMRKSIAIDFQENTGEFILTRKTRDLAQEYSAQAVFAGTYSISSKTIILNGRLISLRDSRVLAAWTNRVVRSKEIDSLLKLNTDPVSGYERPPVTSPASGTGSKKKKK